MVEVYEVALMRCLGLGYAAAEFWSTVVAKTINVEEQLHAIVDGKKIIINESSIRRDLQLADEEDKAVHKELGDSLVRAATTASSLEAEQDNGNINKTQSKATPNKSSSQGTNSGGGPRYQETMRDTIARTRFESASKHSNDSLLARGNTLQSDEDRLKLDELMALCTTLQNRVLDLEQTKTTQHNEIVESSDNEESLGEDASKHGRMDAIDADEEITLVSVHDVNVFAGEEVFIADVAITVSIATTTTAIIKIVDDITLAQALEEMKTIKPKKKRMFDRAFKRVNTFEDFRTELVESKEIRAGIKLVQEIIKKQKVEDDKEITELKQLMKIISDEEEVTINAIPLAVKSPSIVVSKIHKEGRKSYYQIIRADVKSQMYMIFSQMLKGFDSEDLEDLYKLVKAKYESTRPVEDLDLILWVDLKIMFEPHVEDKVWRNQQEYKVLNWKLYDLYVQIYMLVEKKYPLAPLTLSMMLEKKLIIDYESEMAYQLLKFIMKQLKK
ncbi:hypothetical protein Tco_1042226 [Tanacetum coccineum]|uniref:Uncharacterized protein n=1 Tax=Tanacetum coccineum TaxID=301880 RepID=A0ABQ5GIW9_9ASTR